MTASYLAELARVYLRDRPGQFVMLECYLDDSGTHDDSKVVVWGGIALHQTYVAGFESAWQARLDNPCENRPRVNKFHSTDLAASDGEFKGYSIAERDLTRRNFRQVLVDSEVTWISYAISAADWTKHAKGYTVLGFSTPERLVFGRVIMSLCDAAHEHQEPVSFQFDVGRKKQVESIVQPAIEASILDPSLASHGFSAVARNVGLQAADLVAHETYRFFTTFVNDPQAKAHPHLQRLLQGAYDSRVGWFGSTEIQELSQAVNRQLKKTERVISSLLRKPRQKQKRRRGKSRRDRRQAVLSRARLRETV